MTMRRFILLLITAFLVISGAMYLSSQRYLERDPRRGPFFAGLNSRLDTITKILIRKGSPQPAVTLKRGQPGHWTVAERDDYPADVSKVRRLLLGLADAKVVEEKTSTPANYAAIGVDDPVGGAAAGTEVSLVSGNTTAGAIVGRTSGSGTFVRRTGAAKSYVIEPAVSFDASPRDWIDTKLLDIPLEKIRAIDMKLADGTAYSISRKAAKEAKDPKDKSNAEPKDADFTLDKLPPGRESAEGSAIGPSPTTYSGVTVDDVGRLRDIDLSKHSTARVSLFDGGSYTITGSVIGDKHWIAVDAPGDAALSARAKDRAFELASYRYDAIFRSLEQLLKPKPEKSKPSAPASKSKPSKKP